MYYDENYVFFKKKVSFLTAMSTLVLLFLAGLVLQSITFFPLFQMLISIVLVLIAVIFNLTLGTPGFVVSSALVIFQIFIYLYRLFFSFRNSEDDNYYLQMAVMSLALIVMLRLFIRRINEKLETLRGRAETEYNRRIMSENASLTESATLRTSLIVKHDEQAAEAVTQSRINTTDTLTTLPGRDMVISHIDRLIDERILKSQSSLDAKASQHPIYVIYLSVIDSVRFKHNLGHRTIDLFIQCMAHRLREAADPKDLVGRIAGNEFVVVTSRDISEKDLFDYIKVLRSAMNENENSHVYSGYSQYPRDARFPGVLLNNAEAAMRSAIASSTYIESFTSIKSSEDSFLRKMEPAQRHEIFDAALEHDEIHMVYQPCMDKDHKVVGFEAFVRWNSPQYGMVDTRDFLNYAEKTGHIFRIGTIVFERALEELKRINELSSETKMTINLSDMQLKNTDSMNEIISIIKRSECNTSNLILDIPEESLMTDFQNIRPIIEKIKDMGITLALDNFGRGYSSLNNIPLLPVSIVKLDGHFTADLSEDATSKLLTSSIIDLLSEIDISVDATGVETKDQFEALVNVGCAYFQGKYLCDPIADSDMKRWILDNMIK